MKKYSPVFLLIACFLVVSSPALLAQSAVNTTQKTASHGDMPLQMMTFLWDTAQYWDTNSVHYYSYYPTGDLAEWRLEPYNGVVFVPGSREQYSYDSVGHLVSRLSEYWNGSSWVPFHKDDWEFDANGSQTLEFVFSWSGTSWDSTSGERVFYLYDGLQRVTDKWNELWEPTGRQWTKESRERLNYSQYNVPDTIWYFTWFSGAWQTRGRSIDLDWVDYSKGFYRYNRYQRYVGLTWLNFWRRTCDYFLYDSYECEYHTFNGSSWVPEERDFVVNDSKYHQVSHDNYLYTSTWTFNAGTRTNYLYDSNGKTLERLKQIRYSIQDYGNYSRDIFTGHFVGSEEPVVSEMVLRVYPNPAHDRLGFAFGEWPAGSGQGRSDGSAHGSLRGRSEGSAHGSPGGMPETCANGRVSLVIRDAGGRVRMEAAMVMIGGKLDMELPSHFASGVYFYDLRGKNWAERGRFVVQR